MIWKFYINDIEIDEPIGWDGVEFALQRSDEYTGLENLFTEQSMIFTGQAATILKDTFEADGIDGEIEFKIEEYCNGDLVSTDLFILNLVTYEQVKDGVRCKAEKSDFDRKFKNNIDVPIRLTTNTSLYGDSINSFNNNEVRLHSKEIVRIANLIQNQELLSIDNSYTFATGQPTFNTVYFPLQIGTQELNTPHEITNLINFNTLPLGLFILPHFTMNEPGNEINITYKLKGSFTDICTDLREFQYRIWLEYGPLGSTNSIPLIDAGYLTGSGGTLSFDFDLSGTVTIPYEDERKVSFVIAIANYRNFDASPAPSTFILDSDPGNFITFEQVTRYDPSTTRGLLVHEAFANICEAITGERDCFRSDYFGRTNSLPHAYSSDGCGAWMLLTNGLNIRNMKQKDGSYFPVNMSFKQLFDMMNAIHNIGLKIEEEAGKRYIRVEPKYYFYEGGNVLDCSNVSELQITPAIEHHFNEFEIGYKKWETENINGIDEFNTTRSYYVPVKKAKKKLVALNDAIAGGYAIEMTRRVQYSNNPTTDWKFDNDIFLICTNRFSVTSTLYTADGSSQAYPAGTVSERDENFSTVSNLFKPGTAYNLRLSPARSAYNWMYYLYPCIYKKDSPLIKFQSGTGNYQVQTNMSGSCDVHTGILSENEDINPSNAIGTYGNVLYLPIYLDFEYPITYNQFKDVSENSEGLIGVSYCDESYLGYIKDLVYRPERGIAEFKVLTAICVPGGFDEGFDFGFEIATC